MRETFGAITVKIFPPQGYPRVKKIFRAPAGQRFTPKGVEQLQEQYVDWLDKDPVYGKWEWKMVEVGPNGFNFVYVALKAAAAGTADPPKHDATLQQSA